MTSSASVGLAIAFAAVAALYLRRKGVAVSRLRATAFVAGLVALWAAVASPLSGLDEGHLTAHMIQHLLIMTIAAPLLLLGEPGLVFWPRARRFTVHPLICWCAGTLVVLVWHVPGIFEFGMRWHALQHATFFVGGILFWLPVIAPFPTEWRWNRWMIPLYLFFATMPCDGLSAFLTFCGRIIYPRYDAIHAHHGTISALDDQMRAGALMWFWVTIAYLVPAVVVTIELLSSARGATPWRAACNQRPETT
jgi:putative membrane protein